MAATRHSCAESRPYDSIIETLKARAAERGVSYSQLDQISGRADGYFGKIAGPSQTKPLGLASLIDYASALGLKLVLVEDREALERYGHLHGGRHDKQVRAGHTGPVGMHAIGRVLRHLARAGGRASFARKSPVERKRHQQNAANARWRKQRQAAAAISKAGIPQ